MPDPEKSILAALMDPRATLAAAFNLASGTVREHEHAREGGVMERNKRARDLSTSTSTSLYFTCMPYTPTEHCFQGS